MTRLIVNADDFGLSELTNKGIVDCFRQGIVTSTSIMANGKSFEHAAKLAKEFELDVGIHLSLNPEDVTKAILHRLNLKKVEKTFRNQIKKVKKAGIKPTHLDGHKHIHIFPGITEITIKLAKENRINRVRLPLNTNVNLSLFFSIQGLKLMLLSHYARKAKKKFQKSNIKWPEKFYGMLETNRLSIENLKKILTNIQGNTAEIMCHPGYYDANVQSFLKKSREKELMALTDNITKKIVKEKGIKLIGYGEL